MLKKYIRVFFILNNHVIELMPAPLFAGEIHDEVAGQYALALSSLTVWLQKCCDGQNGVFSQISAFSQYKNIFRWADKNQFSCYAKLCVRIDLTEPPKWLCQAKSYFLQKFAEKLYSG